MRSSQRLLNIFGVGVKKILLIDGVRRQVAWKK